MPPSLRVYAAVARRARGAPLVASYPAKLRAAAALGALAAPAAAGACWAGAALAGAELTAGAAVAAAGLGAAAGAVGAGWLAGALAAPVTLAAAALRAGLADRAAGGARPELPADLAEDDEAGALVADARHALERLDEAAAHAAAGDRQTGLANRALFRDQVRHALAQARRDGRPVGVLVLDVQGVQPVSAALGPAAGEALLAAVAARLQTVVRETDVLARLDGHEFGVLCPGGATVEGIDALARRLLDAVRRPFPVAGREARVGGSAGVSLFPADASGVEQLLGNAAAALYDATQAGGGTHRFYSAALNAGLQRRMALEDDLRHALARGELLLHYQPKVCVATGRVRGFEALLRWRHPERGLVSPAEFIPVAEATGLIVPIGAWVLRAACAQLAAWRAAGGPAVSVAVNLSARQFKHGDLLATVRAALEETGVDPALLELEVTESLLMDDTRHTVSVLRALRAAGVTISLDDFGTGYSSLGYLTRFPLDCIKLDKSFVRDAVGDAQSSAITTAIIALGHSLGLTVVAEGVETPDQLAYLAERSCDVVQGFLFGRPVPAEEVTALLAAGAAVAQAA